MRRRVASGELLKPKESKGNDISKTVFPNYAEPTE
jgi:hypothetical protein